MFNLGDEVEDYLRGVNDDADLRRRLDLAELEPDRIDRIVEDGVGVG